MAGAFGARVLVRRDQKEAQAQSRERDQQGRHPTLSHRRYRQRKVTAVKEDKIAQEINRLTELPRHELASRWTNIYGAAPPKGARRVLLERAVAWHIQADAIGGIKKEFLGLLLKAPSGAARQTEMRMEHSGSGPGQKRPRVSRSKVSQGARLIREWHGTTQVVDVVADGYVWQGETYKSLSEIARTITGARWSGPRFFGL